MVAILSCFAYICTLSRKFIYLYVVQIYLANYFVNLQLQEHIFVESNKLTKSIQVLLNCLNELRICHVMQRSSSVPSKQENSKVNMIQFFCSQ